MANVLNANLVTAFPAATSSASSNNAGNPKSFARAHKRAMRQLEKYVLDTRSNRLAQSHPSPSVVVAIPVRNEVERVGRCLEALQDQVNLDGRPLGLGQVRVVLLINGCNDGTYQLVLDNIERWQIPISAFNVRLPVLRQNAGCARRMVNHAALDFLSDKDGLLFMTDADSAVPQNWIARYRLMLKDGYDAVAGLVNLHPDDSSEISTALLHRSEFEDRYSILLDRLDCLVDPVPHDPWPRHYNASGANIAVKASALCEMADFPQIACGEDRMFIRQIEALGSRVRHDCETRVFTSGRLLGRAAGGMADTLRHRLKIPNAQCDPRLEFVDRAYHRAMLRKRLRTAWAERDSFPSAAKVWAVHFDISDQLLVNAGECRTFEEAWQNLEALSPELIRRPVSPCHLPMEILRAQQLVRKISLEKDEVASFAAEEISG